MGLAIGMACCILIQLYIQDEFKYDQYPERNDRIYRLVTTCSTADRVERETAKSAIAWGWMLTDAFPEVEGFTRIKSPLVSWLVAYPDAVGAETGSAAFHCCAYCAREHLRYD
jgi:hypothetical protein